MRRWFRQPAPGIPAPATRFVMYLVLAVWTVIVVGPLYWVLVTSLKLPIQVAEGPTYLPFVDFQPSLHAWRYLLVEVGDDTLRPYLNSIIIAGVSTVLTVLIGSMAAYALSRIQYRPRVGSVAVFLLILAGVVVAVLRLGTDWRVAAAVGLALFVLFVGTLSRRLFRRSLGNNDILFFLISQRVLPPVVVVLPIYVMFQQLGMLDTHAALIVTYTAINLPIVVWLMRDFFDSIPRDLEESAELDGASRLRVFATIVLPLARAGLAATFLLILILAWNEYLLALFLSTVDAQTMPMLVAAQNTTRGPQWWYMSALIVLMIIPVMVMAVILQRFIRRGFLVGAIKG